MSEHHVDQDYLAKRQLKKGTAGWVLLAGLGVSYVISGDFAGWNFGIGVAGWGGFAIAAVLMAVMYLTLVLSLAEMSAAIPAAGGGYSFARQVMGPSGGYLTGLAVLIEYVLAQRQSLFLSALLLKRSWGLMVLLSMPHFISFSSAYI